MEVNVNTIRQTFSKELFETLSYFFSAESKLSELTIPTNSLQRRYFLNECISVFRKTSDKIEEISNALSNKSVTLKTDALIQNYCKEQCEKIRPLHKNVSEIINALEKISPEISADELQQSLWHDGANAIIRTEGISFLKTMIEILTSHISVVEETNK